MQKGRLPIPKSAIRHLFTLITRRASWRVLACEIDFAERLGYALR